MSKRKKLLLLKFITPYILVVLFVFSIQYISNSVVLNALKNNSLKIVKNSFENNVKVIEQNINRIKETATIVAQDTERAYRTVDKSSKDYYTRLLDLKSGLSSYEES